MNEDQQELHAKRVDRETNVLLRSFQREGTKAIPIQQLGPRLHQPTKNFKPQEETNTIDIDTIESVFSVNSDGIQFAVDGLIAMSAVTVISGDAGAGKTTFATVLAGHVATGTTFLHRDCEARKVLMLDRENPAPIVVERLRRVRIQDGGNLKIWGSWLKEEAPQPGSASILSWVIETDPKPLIIVDSLIAFLDGQDENDAAKVRPFMQQMRRLADLGAGVIVLHHTGKGETTKEYRGSSDIKASIDVGLNIINFGEGALGRMQIRPFKTRFSLDASLILNYSDGEFFTDQRPDAVKKTVTEQLTELLREHPGVRTADFETLAAGKNLGRDRGRTFLTSGVSTGIVRLEKGPNNAKFHYLASNYPEDQNGLL